MINNNNIYLGELVEEIETNLNTLCAYVYKRYELDYEKLNKKYGGREGRGHYDFEVDDYDDSWDIVFEPYELAEDEKETMYPIKDNGKYEFDPEDEEYNHDLIKQLDDYVEGNLLRDLVLADVNCMVVHNGSGVNTDARGIRLLDWKLAYHDTVYCYNKITFRKFIDVMYKCKSHKFDYWYELFGGVDKVIREGKILRFELGFDHGS